jgi:hypothetical protein
MGRDPDRIEKVRRRTARCRDQSIVVRSPISSAERLVVLMYRATAAQR